MSEDISGSVTSMMWKPQLIRLTAPSNPLVDGNEPTALYVEPSEIIVICRILQTFESEDKSHKFAPDICVTNVSLRGGMVSVMESPEQVARLRDEALGFKWPLRAV